MKYILIFLLFIIVANYIKHSAITGDPELMLYVDLFSEEIKQPNQVNISFVDEIKDDDPIYKIIGSCNIFLFYKSIIIDRQNFLEASKIERKALLYHELAHCICDLDHNNLQEMECHYSLMNELLPSQYCLEKHWDRYIKILKHSCNND